MGIFVLEGFLDGSFEFPPIVDPYRLTIDDFGHPCRTALEKEGLFSREVDQSTSGAKELEGLQVLGDVFPIKFG